jgi:signal transduction histidine kinase
MEQPPAGTTSPVPDDRGKSRSLRFRLFLIAASGLVPLALVLLLSSVYLARERKTDTQRGALELSRALATAVDAELSSTISLLENLAITTNLQDVDAPQLGRSEFASVARRVVDSQHWRIIVVTNEGGEVVMRAGDAAGRDRSPVEPKSVAQVLSTRTAAVGAVAKGPLGRDAFAVRVPVFKGDQLRYVLSAVVPTSRILDVMSQQQLAPSWIVSIYDRAGNRVARSKESSSLRYSSSLETLINSQGREGMGITRTLEGVESDTGFSRMRVSQWVVAVGIPAAEANADLYRLLLAVGTGTAASLGLLAWLALRAARSISGPIDRLKQAASALGAGSRVELSPLDVQELDEVGLALRQAAIDRDDANARRGKVESERELLLGKLEEALRVAEQANRNKDEFLALLGHELRNPLAPIMNAVHLLGLKGDEKTAPELRIIQRQLSYVTRMVDDLLDASRINSNRLVMNLRPLLAVPVLEQTIESLRPTFGAREVNLHIAEDARLLWIRADEARLVQVLSNLLGNAVKFTDPNGSIEVRVAADDSAIEIVIRDNGVGMNAVDIQRAFEPFYQASGSARAVHGGLGLGLAIVKSLVEMHSGTVEAQSDGPGLGTTITVTLPVIAPPSVDVTVPGGRTGAASTRILVVDDNHDAADTLSMLLGLSGFQVQVAYMPQSALDAVETFQPEVVILDIGLPEMDGYEVARRLRSSAPRFKGKLVAVTGYGQQKDVQKALDAGFDAHLTKPVEPDVLMQLLAGLVGNGN